MKMGGVILDWWKGGRVILDWWKGVGWFETDEKGWGAIRLMERGGVVLDWWKDLGYKMGDS